jgi:hypothetical protein
MTTTDLSRAELWLLITILAYFLMNGAQVFETAVLIPKWSLDPPHSLSLISGKYGVDLKTFWIIVHSLHEITFLLAIYFCWKIDPIRTWLLILFGIHFMVRVWTLVYFAPNIIDFQKIATDGTDTLDLSSRVAQWKSLNYVRVFLFIAVQLA